MLANATDNLMLEKGWEDNLDEMDDRVVAKAVACFSAAQAANLRVLGENTKADQAGKVVLKTYGHVLPEWLK